MYKLVGLTVFISLIYFRAQSQNTSSLKQKTIVYQKSGVLLDSFTVHPPSVLVWHKNEALSFDFDLTRNTLILNDSLEGEKVKVMYRTFPFSFNETLAKRDYIRFDTTRYYREDYNKPYVADSREELFPLENFTKNGALTRGISFGNNQNVFVNSALNLQLEGKLSDEISIVGAISDQNVPLQPEGNTQQIQEFDQVYIQANYDTSLNVRVGDLVMQNEPSAFLRYFKNVQGGAAEYRYKIDSQYLAETKAGAAVSKGKFASTQILAQEGVLGPYRLRGPNNERFIIIIANSERVFLDGKQLTRGFNNDYVIDYNQAEITFNTNIVITQFSRIRVDFEYAERNYSRTILNASHKQSLGKAKVFMNYYSQTDNPRNPVTLELSDQDKRILSEAGDSLQNALAPTADSVGFNENEILYEQIDTIINGSATVIYRYSIDPSEAIYRVSFNEVGPGNGNYVLQEITANGRIYRFSPPDALGNPTGSFAPLTPLPAPTQKGMVTLGAGYDYGDGEIFFETAASQNDLNRFSNEDNQDNQGAAFKMGANLKNKELSFINNYRLDAFADYEFNDKDFAFQDRLRYIEFNRDWSADPTAEGYEANENIFNSGLKLKKDQNNFLNYSLTARKRGTEVNGTQQTFQLSKVFFDYIDLKSDGFYMRNDQLNTLSTWRRFSANAHLKQYPLMPGYVFSIDENAVLNKESDSVLRTAMNFIENKFYVKTSDTAKIRFIADYATRYDKTPRGGELLRATKSETANLVFANSNESKNQLRLNGTYRKLEYLDRADTSANSEETLMGRLDWNSRLLKGAINSDMTYVIGTGRELRREFIFIASAPGEGTHFREDLNGDGEFSFDEYFETDDPALKNYIRIFVPTDEYITAFTNNLNYRLNTKAPFTWRKKKGIRSFVSKFSNLTVINFDKKITDPTIYYRFNPFNQASEEDELVSSNQILRNTLFFNRSSPIFGADLTLTSQNRKQLLTSGFEENNLGTTVANARWNFSRKWISSFKLEQEMERTRSDFIENRNFNINALSVSPELAFQPNTEWRVSTRYEYEIKESANLAEEEVPNDIAVKHRVQLEGRLSQVNKRNVNIEISYLRVRYTGEANTTLGFELLEAFRPGNNFVWNLNYQQKLANGLQLSLAYDGRKSAGNPSVHVGRMQVSALF